MLCESKRLESFEVLRGYLGRVPEHDGVVVGAGVPFLIFDENGDASI